MGESAWWQWAVALGVMGVLSCLGVSQHTEFTTASRLRGCISNCNSVDKCVGVWESQNVALPTDRALWIDVSSNGRILRMSPGFRELPRVPASAVLEPGSDVLFRYVRDHNVFACPERSARLGDALGDKRVEEHLASRPEVHYRWISSPTPVAELGGRKRGVICLLYGEIGPRDEPGSVHAPHPVKR